MKIYSFEKLECWQQARKLTSWIYEITKEFPQDERFGLTSQMRRAALSIASNIAEGTSRKTYKDQAHFSTIAYSSTIELLNQLIISYDLKIIQTEIYNNGREFIERQTFLLSGLRKSQEKMEAATKLSKPSKL
jgi:four helix bundle protein